MQILPLVRTLHFFEIEKDVDIFKFRKCLIKIKINERRTEED